MHFTRQSQFSPGAVYMVIIMKDGDHNRSIGFFHHKKRETGFLTYAGFLSEVRTVEVKRSDPSFVPHTPHVAQFYLRRTYERLRCH